MLPTKSSKLTLALRGQTLRPDSNKRSSVNQSFVRFLKIKINQLRAEDEYIGLMVGPVSYA